MSRKISIEIDDESISDEQAVRYVLRVIDDGRVSEGSYKGIKKMFYCWVTTWRGQDTKTTVYVQNHRKGDCFKIWKGDYHEN